MAPPPSSSSSSSSSGHIGQALRALSIARAQSPVTISQYGRVTTGAQLLQDVASLSSGLRTNLLLQPGDRVAIASLNSEWYLEWLLAVPCAGGVIAPLNYRWSISEACEAVKQIEPIYLVIDQYCADLGAEIRIRFPTIQLITIGYSTEGAFTSDSIMDVTQKELHLYWAPDSIALICFTSGTTGKPKGAAISHGALIVQSLAKIAVVNYCSTDVYLHTSPLCHIGGISSAHAMLMAGGCHIFIPKFQPSDVLKAIEEHQVTAMITVPTMLKDITSLMLSRGGNQGRIQCRSMQTILNGAGSLSSTLLETTKDMFPGSRILSAYGMTEACSSMSFITLYDPKSDANHSIFLRRNSDPGGVCVGKPAPHAEILVRANTSLRGQNSCLNKEGDVFVRGPHLMTKYWGENKAFGDGGWFNTGDVGWMDNQGCLWLLGRQKDVIKSGGENVHCSEVEEILSRHPAIAGAAVAGVQDARLGEVVGAMLLLNNGWKWVQSEGFEDIINVTYSQEEKIFSPKSMHFFCRQQGLSGFKIPKICYQKFGDFPRTSTGKIRKELVREELASYNRSHEALEGSSRL